MKKNLQAWRVSLEGREWERIIVATNPFVVARLYAAETGQALEKIRSMKWLGNAVIIEEDKE